VTTDEKFLAEHRPLRRGRHARVAVYRWVIVATWALLFVAMAAAVVSLYWR
jgi:hypothetical protein